MSPKENETFDEWSKRVAMYEHGRALQMIAQGQDIDSVMIDMSRRIQSKLLHPIFKAIKESSITEFDAEASRREYEEKYLKFRKPVADHVVDD